MLTDTKFKQNVQLSFERTKTDMYHLYGHIKYLQAQVQALQQQNQMFAQKLGLSARTAPLALEVKRYVSSRTSKKVHDSDCAFAKNVKAANKVSFQTVEEALAQGLERCKCITQ